jgi:hypothetical protein
MTWSLPARTNFRNKGADGFYRLGLALPFFPHKHFGRRDQQHSRDIEVLSDDESDAPRPTPLPRRPVMRRPQTNGDVISLSSNSDPEQSDTDLILLPGPPLSKRGRNPDSSAEHSPSSGKRRAAAIAAPTQDFRDLGTPLMLSQPDLRVPPALRHDSLPPPPLPTYHGLQSQILPRITPIVEKPEEQAPYYTDGRFEIKMYRGPGYERFPVALGTIQGHQKICDQWDADKLAREARKIKYLEKALRADPFTVNEDFLNEEEAREESFEKKIIDHVVEVFPDIDPRFVKNKIRDAPSKSQYSDEIDEELIALGTPPLAQAIIAEVLEMNRYPKKVAPRSISQGSGGSSDGTGVTIGWKNALPKDDMYYKDGVLLIEKHFPHVPTCFIDATLKEKKAIFDAYVAIQELEEQYYICQQKPYPRRRQPRTEVEKKYMLKLRDSRIPSEYAERINEVQAAKQHVAREAAKQAAKKAKDDAEAHNLAEHITSGALFECECCYDADTPLNRMVSCMAEQPHSFCFRCVESLVDNQIGMMKHEVLCMSVSGCTASLSPEGVARAIPITAYDRLQANQQQAEIDAAGIEGLEECPYCDYKAICEEPFEIEPVFRCLNPDCSRASCRKCKKDEHTPRSCEEASEATIENARHQIEEARTAAVIRTCPSSTCNAKIIKSSGCNKMICPKCKTFFCYSCGENVTGLRDPYDHFRSGGKCVTYDYQGRENDEAQKAEEEAIAKAKQMYPELDETDLRIGPSDPKSTPSSAVQNNWDRPAADVLFQYMHAENAPPNANAQELRRLEARRRMLEAYRVPEDIIANVRAREEQRQQQTRAFEDLLSVRQQHQQRIRDLEQALQPARRQMEPVLRPWGPDFTLARQVQQGYMGGAPVFQNFVNPFVTGLGPTITGAPLVNRTGPAFHTRVENVSRDAAINLDDSVDGEDPY